MAAVSLFVFLPSLSSTEYVEPGPREVCFWVIYHRHLGLPVCLISLGSTNSQSASGLTARETLSVCFGPYIAHIFPLNSDDRIADTKCFLSEKVKQKWLVPKWVGGILYKRGAESTVLVFCSNLQDWWEHNDGCQNIGKRNKKKRFAPPS